MIEQQEYRPAPQEAVLGQNPRIRLLGTTIDVLTMAQTLELVEEYITRKVPLHLIGVNADKINESTRNKQLHQIINSCGVINADGISVVLASRFLGKPLPERVAGVDLMLNLVAQCEEKGHSIYLLGARQQVVSAAAGELRARHPGLQLAGIHDGYFSEADWPEISGLLEAANPDVVFVGITSPLKEYLVEYLQARGHRCVFMGVGGSFDVISGLIPRAPLWMQRCGLEWLFRVIQEPKRLFRRYFVGNTEFILAVLRERFSGPAGQ